MVQKAYLLIVQQLDQSGEIPAMDLRAIHLLLGEAAHPFLGSDRIFGMVFLSADSAEVSMERVRAAIGDQKRISVLEIGPDHAAWGFPVQNEWSTRLRMLQKRAAGKSRGLDS